MRYHAVRRQPDGSHPLIASKMAISRVGIPKYIVPGDFGLCGCEIPCSAQGGDPLLSRRLLASGEEIKALLLEAAELRISGKFVC